MSDRTHSVIERTDEVDHSPVMHPMAEAILAKNPTPETLRELMNLQREWQKDIARRAFTAALVAMNAELPAFISRDKEVDFTNDAGKRTNYTHASLANVTNTLKPILTRFGFAITCPPDTSKAGLVTVTARLTHKAGHWEEASISAAPDIKGGKSSPQGVGSTITALQRYAILSVLGIATADVDDETPEEQPAAGAPPAADHGRVDATKNLKAMAFFVDQGRTKQQVETFVGRPVSEWTEKDLEKLRGWMQAPGSKVGAPSPANPKSGTAPTQRPAAAPPAEDSGPSPLAFYCGGCLFTHDDPAAFDEHLAVTGHRAGEGSGPKK